MYIVQRITLKELLQELSEYFFVCTYLGTYLKFYYHEICWKFSRYLPINANLLKKMHLNTEYLCKYEI